MKVEQHIPNFAGFKQSKNHFNTTAELLNIDWIKDFEQYPNFYRFSISRNDSKTLDKTRYTLMAEYRNGFKWFVVGFISGEDISAINDLPKWKAKYKNQKR